MRTQGIRTDKATGKAYFTGYPHQTMYDWDQYFEAIIQLYLGWDGTYIRNAVMLFLDNQKRGRLHSENRAGKTPSPGRLRTRQALFSPNRAAAL